MVCLWCGRTDGRAGVRSRDYQILSEGWITSFSYRWCSAAPASRARAPLPLDILSPLPIFITSPLDNYPQSLSIPFKYYSKGSNLSSKNLTSFCSLLVDTYLA